MYSYGPPHMANQKQDGQLEHTYSSYVMIRNVTLKTCQRQWMIGRRRERGSGISVLAARHDDEDELPNMEKTLLANPLKFKFTSSVRTQERERERGETWIRHALMIINEISISFFHHLFLDNSSKNASVQPILPLFFSPIAFLNGNIHLTQTFSSILDVADNFKFRFILFRVIFLQLFGRYVLRPSSGVCRTRELSRNSVLYWIQEGHRLWFRWP